LARANGEINSRNFHGGLLAVGDWLSKIGNSIYGTRVAYAPGDWGVTTQKDNKMCTRLKWRAPILACRIPSKVVKANSLPDAAAVAFTKMRTASFESSAVQQRRDRPVIVLTLANPIDDGATQGIPLDP